MKRAGNIFFFLLGLRNVFQFTFGSKSPPSAKKEGAFFVALAYWPELYTRSEPPYSSLQYISPRPFPLSPVLPRCLFYISRHLLFSIRRCRCNPSTCCEGCQIVSWPRLRNNVCSLFLTLFLTNHRIRTELVFY